MHKILAAFCATVINACVSSSIGWGETCSTDAWGNSDCDTVSWCMANCAEKLVLGTGDEVCTRFLSKAAEVCADYKHDLESTSWSED